MRFVVVLAIVGSAATPAHACPVGARCVRGDAAREEVASAPQAERPVDLRIQLRDKPTWRLDVAPEKPATDEMPWIWQVLRREVYAQMPRYRGEDAFSFTVSPVVIAGSFDTVPGVGVAGDF